MSSKWFRTFEFEHLKAVAFDASIEKELQNFNSWNQLEEKTKSADFDVAVRVSPENSACVWV